MTNTGSLQKSRLNAAKKQLAQGQFQAATRDLQEILRTFPSDGEALGLLGLAHAQQGHIEQALPLLQQAHDLLPQDAGIIANLALAMELTGNLQQALPLYEKAIALQGDNIEAHVNLGDALRQLGRFDESELRLRHAVKIGAGSYKAWNHLGILLEARKDYRQAEQAFRNALALQHNHPGVLNNLGGVLHKLDRYHDAIDVLKQALHIKPDYPQALVNITAAYTMCYQYDNALHAIQRALEINDKDAASWNNYAKLKYELGEYIEAGNAYTRALQLSPNNADTLWHKSFASLMMGDYQHGWQEYEAGLIVGDRVPIKLHCPAWSGELLTNKTLFVAAEQGLGDEVMFASCLPDLLETGANIIYECDSRLIPLLQRSFPKINFVQRKAAANPNIKADFQIAAGSLSGIYRKHHTDFSQRDHFLQADNQKVEKWLCRYQSLGEGLKVGISWRGGTRVDPLKRSLPLEYWLPILNIEHCQFIDIQYGDTQAERVAIEDKYGVTIHHFRECDPLSEQDDFAAQLSALDLIISVSNATVHLAGALGLKTWSLLPFVPSWRWGAQGTTTPWYPVVTLFRQPQMNDWQSLINNVSSQLRSDIEHS